MSTAVNPTHSSVPASSRASSIAANHTHLDSSYANGHHHHHHDVGGAQAPGPAAAKKGKQKKATDPNEASKLIAAKISQLELDAAGEKDQEAEIGWLRPFLTFLSRKRRRQTSSMRVLAAHGVKVKFTTLNLIVPAARTRTFASFEFVRDTTTRYTMGQRLSRAFRKISQEPLLPICNPYVSIMAPEEEPLLTNDLLEEREVKKANRELNNLTSKMDDLQKIETLQKRVTEHLADMKRLERDNQKNKKRGDVLQKEKDHSRTELSKAVGLREKLEKLCRELQRENNRLKSENKTLQDSEKANHSAWDDKFKQLLWQLQDYQDTKDHPQAQVVNIEVEELFKQRFKSLIDQYELRELHFHSLLRSKELEVQYHMARFNKEQKSAEAEVTRSRALNAQVLTFSKTESELRSQLNIYVEKFKQVEDTLNNSNDLFLTFRKEMEEMSKKTKRLEKENLTLTRKHDLTNRNILEMAEERTKNNQEIEALKRKNVTLNNIIKQMQQQGRGVPEGMAGMVEGASEDEEGAGDTESEYDYDDEEGEEGGEDLHDEGDYDTEEDLHPEVFGPAPPPPPTNGVAATNGIKQH